MRAVLPNGSMPHLQHLSCCAAEWFVVLCRTCSTCSTCGPSSRAVLLSLHLLSLLLSLHQVRAVRCQAAALRV